MCECTAQVGTGKISEERDMFPEICPRKYVPGRHIYWDTRYRHKNWENDSHIDSPGEIRSVGMFAM